MPFTFAHHQAIDKAKIESQLMAIFHTEINALQAQGFEDLYFVREIMFPLSGIFAPLVWLEGRNRRDLWQVGGILQVMFFNPLLYNYEFDTYGHIMDLGFTLTTGFEDGTALITCNYTSERRHSPEAGIYFYSSPNVSIETLWQEHQRIIAEMERDGKQTDSDLTLEKYTAIIQQSDRLSIFSKDKGKEER